MRVLVSGDRWWAHTPGFDKWEMDASSPDYQILCNLLDGYYIDYDIGYEVAHLDKFTIISGKATGADSVADWWAINSPTHHYDEDRFEYLPFPAEWRKYGKSAGPMRNIQMIDQGKPDVVLVFHHDIGSSFGTKHMVSIAYRANIPTYVIG